MKVIEDTGAHFKRWHELGMWAQPEFSLISRGDICAERPSRTESTNPKPEVSPSKALSSGGVSPDSENRWSSQRQAVRQRRRVLENLRDDDTDIP